MQPEGADSVVVSGQEGSHSRSFPAALVRKALALGLVLRDGNALAITPEARAYLRRALVEEPDEAFLEQHRLMATGRAEIGDDWQTVRINLQCAPLNLIARLKDRSGALFLPPEAVEAGERLHADFTRGQLQPCVTANWEPRLASRCKIRANGVADLCDSAAGARQRVTRALDAIGPELAGVALDVCCFLKGLETVEGERQWPARSAKLLLRAALMALARHYCPRAQASPAIVRHWGEDDFRPQIGV